MMQRTTMALATLAWVCVAASSAGAHHSHPIFYDWCRSVSLEGRVESVQWKDPHILVVVSVADGTAYTLDWISLTGAANSSVIGPAKAALVVGARVAVTGYPIRSGAEIRKFAPDYKYETNPNTVDPMLIRRVDQSWNWARQVGNPPDCTGR